MDVKTIAIIILGVSLLGYFILTLLPTIGNHSVGNVSVTFAANNTYYSPGSTPIYTGAPYTPTLNFVNGTDVGAANYTFTSTGVKISAATTNGTYYATYTYYDQPWVGGTNYLWVISIIMIAGLGAVVLRLMGLF